MDGESSWLWIVILGFIIAFVLAFGLGANDVANSFGTSVGARVLTIRQACILGTIFEVLGAVLVGAKVSNTIRKGIVSPDIFTNGTEEMFLAGNVAALTGSCIWLLGATFLSLPVSGTHSIVGATLGFSLVMNGTKGISWVKLGMIVGSWFISPAISGFVSCLLFKFIDISVLKKNNPLKYGLRLLPIFYAVTVAVNLFSIFYDGSKLLRFDRIPLYGVFILTFGPAIIVTIFVRVFIVPRQRQKIQKVVWEEENTDPEKNGYIKDSPSSIDEILSQQIIVKDGNLYSSLDDIKLHGFEPSDSGDSPECSMENSKAGHESLDINVDDPESGIGSDNLEKENEMEIIGKEVEEGVNLILKDTEINGMQEKLERGSTKSSEMSTIEKRRAMARDKVNDDPETAKLFTFLQVLTAVFGSFAHGGNDVSNAIGPLVAVWITYTTGSTAQSAPVPIWVLIYGGAGISVGLWVWGRRVMKTLGEDLTKITPSSGFCIEVGSALTVLIASNIGIPISTTHCKVGSVVCVGRVRSSGSVDWSLFRNIIFAWFVTLPVSGGLSALAMLGYRAIINAL